MDRLQNAPLKNNQQMEARLSIIPSEKVSCSRVIESEGFGIIYFGSWKTFQVAIKILRERGLEQEFLSESNIMAKLEHPRIVRFFGICQDPYIMIMELMPMGNLSNLLSNRKQQIPWEPKRWQWALDIGAGLAYLHSKNILHRNLNSRNVLLDEHFRAKIADFGFSRLKAKSKLYTYDSTDSLPWMAPELFAKDVRPTPASDIYAYGITLWEIAARQIPFAPFSQRNINVIRKQIKENKNRPSLPKKCPAPFAKIITSCWAQDPKKRPSATKVLKTLQQTKPTTIQNSDNPASLSKIIEITHELTTFIGRKDHLASLKKSLIDGWQAKGLLRLHALAGPEGVGKSGLAGQFANQFLSHFDLVYWIPSATRSQREGAFRNLNARLGLPLKQKDTYSTIKNRVYNALENRSLSKPYLLIFDDLEEKETFPSNGSILITTQNSSLYTSSQTLTIKPFTEQESIQFVQVATKDTDLASIKTLVNVLDNFPLTLATSCAYIAKKDCTTSEYLQNFDIQALLKETSTKRRERSLLATLQLTLKALDPVASQWFTLCAYLASDNIPKMWVTSWLQKQKLKISKGEVILNNLRNHGLISYARHGDYFSIHPLLQQILRFPRTEQHYHQALSFLTEIGKKFDRGKAETWEIGNAFLPHTKAFLAYDFLKKADQKTLVTLLNQIGDVEAHLTNHDTALNYHEQALALLRKLHGNKHPDVATALNNIGNALENQGKVEKALVYYKQALPIWQKTYGNEHPKAIELLNAIGGILCNQGKTNEALVYYKQSLPVWQKLFGSKHPNVAQLLNVIGGILDSQGKIDEALVYYKRALPIWQKTYGNEHPKAIELLHIIGKALHNQGKIDEALVYRKQAQAVLQKMYGSGYLNVPTMGSIYLAS